MLNTIHFYGPLEEKFGIKTMKLDVGTPRMIVRGMCSQVPGFEDYLDTNPLMRIVMTNANASKVYPLTPEEFDMPLGDATDIHFLPAMEGAGIETALVAAFVSWGASAAVAAVAAYVVMHVGMMIVLGVISKALAPSPDTSAGAARPDEKPSFLYNGAVNVVEQGYPVPLVFGSHMVGSIVVSAGVSVEEIAYTSGQTNRPANGGGSNQPNSPSRESYQY